MDDETRFDLYGALWLVCSRYHSGMSSRGYRILSRLAKASYRPGLSVQNGLFETEQQEAMYHRLRERYAEVL